MKLNTTVGGILQNWLRFLLGVLLIFLGMRVFVVDAYSIPTSSMENTLLAGDFLLVNKLAFGARIPGTDVVLPSLRDPVRDEIVVFFPPHDHEKHYVKRVVGLPGDTLEMKLKALFRNGEAVDEAFVRHLDGGGDTVHPAMRWQRNHLVAAGSNRRYAPSRDTWGPLVVPEGKYFVLGDNRDNSEDSRYWGFVDRADIHGKPWKIYLSLEEDGGGERLLRRVRWNRIAETIQ